MNTKKSSSSAKEFVAKLSRGLMLPIAILPIAGLFLGIGAAISSTAEGNFTQETFGKIISAPGDVIFGALPVLFAIAVAIAFTGDAGVAGLSAFVGWIVFCAFQQSLIIRPETPDKNILFLFYSFSPQDFKGVFGSSLGIQTLNTSVFGGITVGLVVAYLYNKFKNIELPTVLGFFNGVRFIPIITFLGMIILSSLFALIWPLIGMLFLEAGKGLTSAPGGVNSLVFGYLNRALVPFGLHHVLNTTLWFSTIGGTFDHNASAFIESNGSYFVVLKEGAVQATWADLLGDKVTAQITGDLNIYIKVLMHLVGRDVAVQWVHGETSTLTHYTLTFDSIFRGSALNFNAGTGEYSIGQYLYNPGQYTTGAYLFTLFGLPAAALAMVLSIKDKVNRKLGASIIISAAFTCFLTGITEPLEFTFLFLAPWLYWGFHAIMSAIGFAAMTAMTLYLPTGWAPHLSFSFSSGFLDFSIYGIVPDVTKGGCNCWIPLLGSMAYGVIYFFFFYWAINKFNIKTPGREGTEVKLVSKKDYLEAKKSSNKGEEMTLLATEVIKAYGNKENIVNVDACITKLRIEVKDQSAVDFDQLKKLGAAGVMKIGDKSVYAVFGTKADIIKNKIKEIL